MSTIQKGIEDGPAMSSRVLKTLVLVVCCAVVVIPFLGVISTSIASQQHVTNSGGFVLWPDALHLDAYKAIFNGGVVQRALLVSVVIAVGGTLISLAGSTMLAYSLSRKGSFGQRPILMIVLFSILFSPGLIPNYLVVKQFGLLDSLFALILPTAISGFNVIVLRSFFMGIPDSVLDSARIDGAGDFRIFWSIVLPLSRAVLAVVGLFYAVGYWNAFFNAMLYISDTAKWPLQLVLRTYVINNTELSSGDLGGAAADQLPPQESIQMAILVVSLVPILIVYPFLQRHFAKGMLTGAVKG
ncbi:multiple sugar transport system permease protein/putative aldouronate transport system permease protein [Kribbella rubisoli]|jgi:putative aldouronate transport system permease protein|uniref:Multiple sugar transport system permease protein/putative aldouronate transport system permease protein n=1 Tax=Kribbella rubisoli TaxID=3075929 RepID=A0A4Q7W242_9ACTN|nr:carbohydrate ABC transporter permease [Kribbella rubisoli]RZU03240.1 multiple sugar transport system permease protein/putative aldouronate transport system permease protein [Kribbella rubisoli]